VSPAAASAADPAPAAASPHRVCGRCEAILRASNGEDICDPCQATIESCRPFFAETPREPAPEHVNLMELVAGIMLTHDALHPGEPLYLREALAEYGVEADHVAVHQAAKKLARRHRLILEGEPRQPGYRVADWLWTARRTRSSVAQICALPADNQRETGNSSRRDDSAPTLFQAQTCTE
jgi:hypothetical protein